MSRTAAFSRWLPWRFAPAGWLAFAFTVVLGVPLFVRMPLWCDATLYDVAARNVLSGGVHYRDVFDTNTPGFVWAVCLIRMCFGWSSEAIRIADLMVVAAVGVTLLALARRAGASRAALAWTAAAFAAFYLFTSEFNHIQRDVWMMLPAGIAVWIRLRRIENIRTQSVSSARVFRGAVLEAGVWGLGFWIKPHLGLVALPIWLITAPRLGSFRRLLADVAGQLVGLALVGGAGVLWLVASGAWPYFLDVNQNWNTGYWTIIRHNQPDRDEMRFSYFIPWTDALRLALPLALVNVIGGLLPRASPARIARAALGVMLLSWFAIGLYLQRPFPYVHVPEVLLMLALFAANRLTIAFWLILVQVAAGVLLWHEPPGSPIARWHERQVVSSVEYAHLAVPHPAFNRDRTGGWAECWGSSPTRELRRSVSVDYWQLGGSDPVQLGEVEDFLKLQDLHNGELLCWHDSPHVLYLTLNLRPPIRYVHVGTAMSLGRPQRERVCAEVRAAIPHVKFVVSDLHRLTVLHDYVLELEPDGLPWMIPDWQRVQFPFDQPLAFRSSGGRYLVHRIENPVGECVIPMALDEPDPPEGWQMPANAPPRRRWKASWRDPD